MLVEVAMSCEARSWEEHECSGGLDGTRISWDASWCWVHGCACCSMLCSQRNVGNVFNRVLEGGWVSVASARDIPYG